MFRLLYMGVFLTVTVAVPSLALLPSSQTEEYRKIGCDHVLEQLTLSYIQANEEFLKEKFLGDFKVTKIVDSHLYLTKVQDLDPGGWDVRRRSWYIGMALLSDGTFMKVRVTALTLGQLACHLEELINIESLSLEK